MAIYSHAAHSRQCYKYHLLVLLLSFLVLAAVIVICHLQFLPIICNNRSTVLIVNTAKTGQLPPFACQAPKERICV